MDRVRLGPFDLYDVLGHGGTGTVFRAAHRALDVPVAVKVLGGRRTGPEGFDEAVRAEIQAVGALDHPGILWLFDHGTVDPEAAAADPRLLEGAPWLAVELASLGDLDSLVDRFTWPQIRTTLLGLLDALAHAHARGVIHRDLKPSNVLFAGPGDLRPGLKLSDFGLATAGIPTEAGTKGTPRYMAPEQFRQDPREIGPWTDLYALGCLAWRQVTGRPPFDAKRAPRLAHQHLYDPPPPLAPRFEVPEGLEAWLRRLLHKEPDARFRRAADAAFALRELGTALRPAVPLDARVAPARDRDTLDDLLDAADDLSITLPHGQAPLPETLREPEVVEAPLRDVRPPPVPASWRAGHVGEAPPPLMGTALFGRRAVPLVGREAERHRLWSALRRVHDQGCAQAVVLRGPAGVGKSALARWLGERAHEVGAATPLTATHDPLGGRRHGLVPMIAAALRVTDLTGPSLQDRLRRRLVPLGLDDPADLADIGRLLAPNGPGEPLSTGEARALIRRGLARLAEERPLLLWLDDVQWGPATLELVHDLLSGAPARVLALLTVQEEALAEAEATRPLLEALDGLEGVVQVDLGPLPADDVRHLVQALLPVSADLADRVVERVDGNPLFAVQLLGDWVARDLLVPTEAGLDLPEGAGEHLPDDLHGVWSDRLDRVLRTAPVDDRPALEIAAALGVQVDAEEWSAACALDEVRIPEDLVARLVSERLARRTPNGWSFGHGMLQESVARRAIERGTWVQRQRACGRALSTRPGADAAARAGRHWLGAGEPERAVGALLDALRVRIARDEIREGSDVLSALEDALVQLDAPADDGRWGVWRLLGARICKARQDLAAAEDLARLVEADAQRFRWGRLEPEALAELADIARVRGDLPEAQARFEEALLAFRGQDDDVGIADTLRSLAAVLILRGEAETARAHLDEARAVYEGLEDRVGAAMCLAGVGDIARMRQRWDEGERAIRASLAILRAEGHRSGIALGLHGLAEIHRLTGRLEEAEAGYLEVIALDEALGRDTSLGRFNVAQVRLARGAFAEAAPLLDDLETTFGHSGRPGYLAVVHVAGLPASAGLGRWAAWHRHITEADRLLRESGMVDVDVAHLAQAGGDLAARSGRSAEAARAWGIALDQWTALGDLDRAEEVEEALARLGAEGTMRRPTRTLRVVAAAILHEGRVLAAKRGPTQTRPNLWELPGGKVEPGEDDRGALVRELDEELAMRIVPVRRLGRAVHDYGDVVIELVAWVCTWDGGGPELREHAELRWLGHDVLDSVDWAEADISLVRALPTGDLLAGSAPVATVPLG